MRYLLKPCTLYSSTDGAQVGRGQLYCAYTAFERFTTAIMFAPMSLLLNAESWYHLWAHSFTHTLSYFSNTYNYRYGHRELKSRGMLNIRRHTAVRVDGYPKLWESR